VGHVARMEEMKNAYNSPRWEDTPREDAYIYIKALRNTGTLSQHCTTSQPRGLP